jgi:hypothetical protein
LDEAGTRRTVIARIAAWSSPVLVVLGVCVTVAIALLLPEGLLADSPLPGLLALGAFEAVFLAGAGTGLVGAMAKSPSTPERVIAGISGVVSALTAVAGCGLALFVLAYVTWAVNALVDLI